MGWSVVAIGGLDAVAALLATAQALLAHESGDAITTVAFPAFLECVGNPRAAVTLPARTVDGLNLSG